MRTSNKLLLILTSVALFYVTTNLEAQKRQRPSLPETGLSEEQKARKEFMQQEWDTYMSLKSATNLLDTDDNIDITFYHITLDVNISAKSISGNTYIELFPLVNNLSQLRLNLHNSMTITSIGEDGASWNRLSNNTINITLDRPYQIGESVKLRIHYHGTPIVASGTIKGFRFDEHSSSVPSVTTLSTPYLSHYWFPCKDGPYDKADSIKVDITVPDQTYNNYPLMAVSNGMLVSDEISGGKRTYRWEHNYPIVPYYVSVSVSNYRVFGEQYNRNGHDFPLTYYVFPQHYTTAQSTFSGVPELFDAFIHYFGDYPFKDETYGMTQIAHYWFIENQTNSVMGSVAPGVWWLVVHELAHMWFGNSITNTPWKHIWLNEGFATYAEALYEEYVNGKNAYHSWMNDMNSRWNETQTLFLQDDGNPSEVFVTYYYQKGAWVLHMLRHYLGDEMFFDIIKSYAQDPLFKYKYVDTEMFRQYVETLSGRNLYNFFDQWVYDVGFADYDYNFQYNPSTGITGVTLNQVQKEWHGFREIFDNRVELKINFNDGTYVRERIYNTHKLQSYHFNHNKPVSSIQFDPDNWLINHAYRENSLAVPPAPMITSFTIPGQENSTLINESNRTIHISMPTGTNISSLSPTIGLTSNTIISPASEVNQDFTDPVEYTVTGVNNSQRVYTVYVSTVASDNKQISSFVISGQISSNINHEEETILVLMPPGTNINSLTPEISVSLNATINPASGESQDFSIPVVYTVTAENGTQKSYTVIVETDDDSEIINEWTGAVSGDWSHAGNWSHGVPLPGMSVYISAQSQNFPVVNNDISISNITIAAGASLIHNSGVLTITDKFSLKSSVDVNASYVAKGGSLIVSPENVKIEQIITNAGYNYAMSSPVSGSLATKTFTGITGTTYTYHNPTGTFVIMDDETTFVPGTGMVFKNNSPILFSGVLNSGSIMVPVTRTSAGLGWNFIGNPYTAAVDWRLLEKENIDDLFWIYKNETGTYAAYNNHTGLGVGLNSPPYLIPSSHAIWVRITQGQTNGSVTFTPEAITENPFSYLKTEEILNYPYLKIQSLFGGYTDEAAIALVAEATKNGSDRFDSEKLFGSNPDMAEIYSLSQSRKLAINALPPEDNMTIPIGVYIRKSGVLIIKLGDYQLPENTIVFLNDKLTGNITELTSGQIHRVLISIDDDENSEFEKEELTPTFIDDRFELIITKSTATGFEEELNSEIQNPSNDDVHVYNSENGIIVYPETKSSPFYLLYDSTGRRISTGTLQPYAENNINLPQRGIYIISIIWENNVKNRKIVF
ncbi:M1 family aminopeptidase [Natronoflexus pectinivorans]|uniref:Aminopeptidase N n=1 Tax=Natronoflexus pectinivorans TaxID=682526 RepID=A0A4R2GGG6_9BACT|nr:M1 family aminopeptidase [Natronoflexus pectinivorans]TCO06872.1 putative secreted protein (Por secretion system target) [Natronoflexus pectinivorans]